MRVRTTILFSILVGVIVVACSGDTPEPTATPPPTLVIQPTAEASPTPEPTGTPAPTATPPPTPATQRTGLFDYTRAVRLLEVEEYKDAIASFGLVIRRNPDFALAFHGRGRSYYHEDLYEAALEDFTRAIELDGELAHSYRYRGMTYQKLGEKERAIADLEKALTLYTRSRDAQHRIDIRGLLDELEQ